MPSQDRVSTRARVWTATNRSTTAATALRSMNVRQLPARTTRLLHQTASALTYFSGIAANATTATLERTARRTSTSATPARVCMACTVLRAAQIQRSQTPTPAAALTVSRETTASLTKTSAARTRASHLRTSLAELAASTACSATSAVASLASRATTARSTWTNAARIRARMVACAQTAMISTRASVMLDGMDTTAIMTWTSARQPHV